MRTDGPEPTKFTTNGPSIWKGIPINVAGTIMDSSM